MKRAAVKMGGAIWIVGAFVVLLYTVPGCGKSPVDNAPGSQAENSTEIDGRVAFGIQCPYGTFQQPRDVPLFLWDCPLGAPKVELARPLPSFVLQADCTKKLITIRSLDGKVDSTWEVAPNDTFSFTIDPGRVALSRDADGRAGCEVQAAMEVNGRLSCAARDSAVIKLETIWWLGKPVALPSVLPSPAPAPSPMPQPVTGPSPSPSASPSPHSIVVFATPPPGRIDPTSPAGRTEPTPTAPECRVPSGCYLYAEATLKQCQ